MVTRIQLRRDSAANWTSTNPILDQGEPGYEISSSGSLGNLKIGDGASRWTQLPYHSGPDVPIPIPIATQAQLGGVIQGDGVLVGGSGILTLTPASGSTIGGVTLGPAFFAYQTQAQNITSLTTATGVGHIVNIVKYDTTKFKTVDQSTFDNAGNFTPYRTGYYQVNATVTISTGPATPAGQTSAIGLGISVNGAGLSGDSLFNQIVDFNLIPGTFGDTTAMCSTVVKITSHTDTIQAAAQLAFSDSSSHTAQINVTNTSNSTLSVVFLRDL